MEGSLPTSSNYAPSLIYTCASTDKVAITPWKVVTPTDKVVITAGKVVKAGGISRLPRLSLMSI